MTWFFSGLVPPLLYAITNHIDKQLLSKYFPEASGVTTLLMFSAVLSVIVVPVAYFMDSSVLEVSFYNVSILGLVAMLDITLIWAYLKALQQDDSTSVIVFYQSMPVMALILGYIILGETITLKQGFSMAIIISGTALVSFDNKTDGTKSLVFKKKTVLYMMLACFAWSLETVTFKLVALEENVWRSLFWEHVVLTLIALIAAVAVPKQRRVFLERFKKHKKGILALNMANEGIYLTGNVVMSFVTMAAPVALVLLMQTYQAIFVFAISILLAVAIPTKCVEVLPDTRTFFRRLAAIAITGVGSYLLLV